ncbi:MAG: dihydroneopterin aldolase [Clostridia bacterium]
MNYKLYKNYFVFATHGHAIQEKELGQKFVIDVTLFGKDLNKMNAAIADDVIENIIQEIGVEQHWDMIQAASSRIADKILALSTEDILEVRVEFKKPSTPVRIGMPGGLVKYVSTTVSKRRAGYKTEYTQMEDYNYTKIRSARVFNKDVRYEVDLEVAFPMEDSIREDDVAYSYSYTTIYDVAVDTVMNNLQDSPAELLQKMIDYVYKDNTKAQMVRATIRNFMPENNMSLDYMEYQLVK